MEGGGIDVVHCAGWKGSASGKKGEEGEEGEEVLFGLVRGFGVQSENGQVALLDKC